MRSEVDSIPNFEGAAATGGHNRLSVWREGHRVDDAAVGVGFLALELQCGCEGQGESASKETSNYGFNARLNSKL